MNILDLIQTICAITSLIISVYALNEVRTIKKKISNSFNKTNQQIKGSGNFQSGGDINYSSK